MEKMNQHQITSTLAGVISTREEVNIFFDGVVHPIALSSFRNELPSCSYLSEVGAKDKGGGQWIMVRKKRKAKPKKWFSPKEKETYTLWTIVVGGVGHLILSIESI